MTPYLIVSVILFTIAMVLYTIGVWSIRKATQWQGKYIAIFLMGVGVDILATGFAFLGVGGLVLTPHAIIGFISLALMIMHGLWGVMVWRDADAVTFARFRKTSLIVWVIWMISYISGFASGLMKVF